MLSSDFPSVVAILLQIALKDALKQYSARLLVLKQQLIDLSLVPDIFLRLDALAYFEPSSVKHFVVTLEHPHH